VDIQTPSPFPDFRPIPENRLRRAFYLPMPNQRRSAVPSLSDYSTRPINAKASFTNPVSSWSSSLLRYIVMESDSFWIAFGLTLFAGMATGIGSVIAFVAKETNHRFLSISTGFSAGVMLYVSFVEILQKGATSLTEVYGPIQGTWMNVGFFFFGILLVGLIDNFIPEKQNPHEQPTPSALAPLHSDHPKAQHQSKQKLLRMALFTAFAIALHNFPEGLATFLAALENPKIGIAIAVAIALHNIPEGISVSVPLFYATGSRTKAFTYSFLSGLAEPVGAAIGYFGLRWITGGEITSQVMGACFAGVAGIMVYISLDELLPTSRAYGKGHDSLLGLVAGMVVMAISLLLIK
jgi:ZIP family zinc transporter